MTVQVPLVVYENGIRREIGVADVDFPTGEVESIITDPHISALIQPFVKTDYSIVTYSGDNITHRFVEVAYSPQLATWNGDGMKLENGNWCVGHNPIQHRDGKSPWCGKCGMDALGRPPQPLFMNASNSPEDFQEKAMQLVVDYYNESHDISEKITGESVYVVWSSKTLQNWKAMLSTTLPDGMYYEVTYNGDKKESYVDAYQKVANVKILD